MECTAAGIGRFSNCSARRPLSNADIFMLQTNGCKHCIQWQQLSNPAAHIKPLLLNKHGCLSIVLNLLLGKSYGWWHSLCNSFACKRITFQTLNCHLWNFPFLLQNKQIFLMKHGLRGQHTPDRLRITTSDSARPKLILIPTLSTWHHLPPPPGNIVTPLFILKQPAVA
jgi:hypothetical protein